MPFNVVPPTHDFLYAIGVLLISVAITALFVKLDSRRDDKETKEDRQTFGF